MIPPVYDPSTTMPVSNDSRYAVADIHRLTGKRYPKLEAVFDRLSTEEARELLNLCRDIDGVVRQKERRAAMEPWKHGGR